MLQTYRSIEWCDSPAGGFLRLLDQTALPEVVRYTDCRRCDQAWDAIKQLKVRGAPAIGVAAAYSVLLSESLQPGWAGDSAAAERQLLADIGYLKTSRPTAVNLFWALDRMSGCLEACSGQTVAELRENLLREARAIHAEDTAMCLAIGRHGAELLSDRAGVLTHCNTGGLATSQYGTALSVVMAAVEQGKKVHVYADETRPLLQGSRLTMWELQQCGIPATLICDSMAAQVMREGRVQAVIVGADRITARGDAANKIGTYSVAIAARYHRIPFYVAAPSTTFDFSLEDGCEIPIEQRDRDEVVCGFGKPTAPQGVDVYNPAFDVTPAELITGIITEHGVIQPVDRRSIQAVLRSPKSRVIA